jgi:hypothetical protein
MEVCKVYTKVCVIYKEKCVQSPLSSCTRILCIEDPFGLILLFSLMYYFTFMQATLIPLHNKAISAQTVVPRYIKCYFRTHSTMLPFEAIDEVYIDYFML